MHKIAVIGRRETVMGFTALGLEAYPTADGSEAKAVLRELTHEREDVAIIYIEEDIAAGIMSQIDKFKDSVTPAIILIPSREGSLGMGLSALNAAVERAIGTNILENN